MASNQKNEVKSKSKKKKLMVIFHTKVYGLDNALIKSGNSMRANITKDTKITDNDVKRAKRLTSLGNGTGHDNFLKGIIVQFDVDAPLYWWKQAQRYKWFEFISSTSTMHCLVNNNEDRQFDLDDRCNQYVWSSTIKQIKKRIEDFKNETDQIKKNEIWYEIISNLPCGFKLQSSMTTNYLSLKTMYSQRKNHRLKEWSNVFAKWVKGLPHSYLITGEDVNG